MSSTFENARDFTISGTEIVFGTNVTNSNVTNYYGHGGGGGGSKAAALESELIRHPLS